MPCTTILVGKAASYDGSTIIARNDDSGAGSYTPKKYAVVLNEVADGCTCVGVPARTVRRHNKKIRPCDDLDQTHIPDPTAQEICKLMSRLNHLEKKLETMQKELEDSKHDKDI